MVVLSRSRYATMMGHCFAPAHGDRDILDSEPRFRIAPDDALVQQPRPLAAFDEAKLDQTGFPAPTSGNAEPLR